jgi:hypothetical protein
MSISRIVAKFKATGSVHNQLHARVAPAMTELDISAAESIIDAPTLSLRRRAAALGVSQSFFFAKMAKVCFCGRTSQW